jgi:methylmalonyl-CoA/ethylmalonyl-CoA epimerase
MNNKTEKQTPFSKLIQIGVVVKDMQKTIERLSALGIGPFQPKIPPAEAEEYYRGKPFHAYQVVDIKSCQLGNVELELIQPLDGGSPHKEYLDAKGEGIQHLGFAVKNLDEAARQLQAQGCTPLLTARMPGGGGVVYLDLEAGGIIAELIKTRD